jgi:hypothetical protein
MKTTGQSMPAKKQPANLKKYPGNQASTNSLSPPPQEDDQLNHKTIEGNQRPTAAPRDSLQTKVKGGTNRQHNQKTIQIDRHKGRTPTQQTLKKLRK